MVVSGLPVRIPDHAEQIAMMALDLLHQSGRFKIKHLPEVPLQLRIGLHTGTLFLEWIIFHQTALFLIFLIRRSHTRTAHIHTHTHILFTLF